MKRGAYLRPCRSSSVEQENARDGTKRRFCAAVSSIVDLTQGEGSGGRGIGSGSGSGVRWLLSTQTLDGPPLAVSKPMFAF